MARIVKPMLLVLVVLLVLAPVGVRAQGDGPTDNQVNEIADDLYCPVCENIPLDACGTQACIQWRSLIREKLAAGWTEEEIKQYFVDQYGDRVLATPPARGLNWLVYVVPPVGFLIGAAVLVQALRTWRREPSGVRSDGPQVDEIEDPYVARLEAELHAREVGDTQEGRSA
ncbi:MAG: cytochrome c-type biogenesis protein CcmH [Anaerolineales bacterium]|nr:cytochrome c-type biogenesis protein CcmH [Anaerolineales bacterium]